MTLRNKDWKGDEIPSNEEWTLRSLVDGCRKLRDYLRGLSDQPESTEQVETLIAYIVQQTDAYDLAKVDPGFTPIETQSLAGYYKDQCRNYQRMYEEQRSIVYQLQDGQKPTQEHRWLPADKTP